MAKCLSQISNRNLKKAHSRITGIRCDALLELSYLQGPFGDLPDGQMSVGVGIGYHSVPKGPLQAVSSKLVDRINIFIFQTCLKKVHGW